MSCISQSRLVLPRRPLSASTHRHGSFDVCSSQEQQHSNNEAEIHHFNHENTCMKDPGEGSIPWHMAVSSSSTSSDVFTEQNKTALTETSFEALLRDLEKSFPLSDKWEGLRQAQKQILDTKQNKGIRTNKGEAQPFSFWETITVDSRHNFLQSDGVGGLGHNDNNDDCSCVSEVYNEWETTTSCATTRTPAQSMRMLVLSYTTDEDENIDDFNKDDDDDTLILELESCSVCSKKDFVVAATNESIGAWKRVVFVMIGLLCCLRIAAMWGNTSKERTCGNDELYVSFAKLKLVSLLWDDMAL